MPLLFVGSVCRERAKLAGVLEIPPAFSVSWKVISLAVLSVANDFGSGLGCYACDSYLLDRVPSDSEDCSGASATAVISYPAQVPRSLPAVSAFASWASLDATPATAA